MYGTNLERRIFDKISWQRIQCENTAVEWWEFKRMLRKESCFIS
jgi:hypothetical protein